MIARANDACNDSDIAQQGQSLALDLNRAEWHWQSGTGTTLPDPGFWEIQEETRAGDVMARAGAGGVAEPAPDVRHQPASSQCPR